MIFKKYSEIENAYNSKFISKIEEQFPEEVSQSVWVVTEKIHGANFSFLKHRDKLICCKRSGPIPEDENFYNHQEIINKYGDNVSRLIDYIGEEFKSHGDIQIYGEIYGGSSNDAVKSKFKAVQKGVFYTPEIEFAGFGAKLDNNSWVPRLKFVQLATEFGVPTAPVLAICNFSKALEYSNKFNSIVARDAGYVFDDNICEGVVIEPDRTLYLRSGERVIIKNKNSQFSEKVHGGTLKTRVIREQDEDVTRQLTEVKSLVNMNRVNAVISKIGQIDKTRIGMLIGLTAQDALDELNKTTQYRIVLTEDQIKSVNTSTNKLVSNLIKQNLADIL